MRILAASVLLASCILAAIAAWLGRYDTTAAAESVYITDRWDGTTVVCFLKPGSRSICPQVYPPSD
jgi:hypothetical protein